MINYRISSDNIHLNDSYTIKRTSEMENFLQGLKRNYPNNEVLKQRTISSMVREWESHNLFYYLHLWRSHTKDVDLNLNQPWYVKVAYFILSIFYI